MGLLVLLLVGLVLAVLKDRKLKAANKYPKGSAAAPRKGAAAFSVRPGRTWT